MSSHNGDGFGRCAACGVVGMFIFISELGYEGGESAKVDSRAIKASSCWDTGEDVIVIAGTALGDILLKYKKKSVV